MKKCLFCGASTSFKFEGEREYNGKFICPKCQSEKIGTKFGGCTQEDNCSIKLKSE